MLKNISYVIRDYFGFSRTESRGLLLIFLLMLTVMVGSIAYEKYAVAPYQSLEQDQRLLEALTAELDARLVIENTNRKPEPKRPEIQRFNFDPNTADFVILTKLGIPDYLARRIEKYRSKGGSFRYAEELLKIYGFPDDLYRELSPFIRIEKKVARQTYTKPDDGKSDVQPAKKNESEAYLSRIKRPERIRLNINETDSLALQQLNGIGKVISSRIIKFRDQLGVIHSVEQLQEVYHINDQAIKSLQESVFVEESFETKKININQADFKTLLTHPYISYKMAKGIMNHRRIYGNFTSADQLKEVYQMNEELLVKLLPYLVI